MSRYIVIMEFEDPDQVVNERFIGEATLAGYEDYGIVDVQVERDE